MAGQHSLFSPSGLKRGLLCPGSYALTIELRKQGIISEESTSEAAAKGTVGHAIAEECLKKGIDAKEWIGVSVEQEGYLFELDEGFCNHVQTYVDAIRLLPGEPQIEKRFVIDAFPAAAGEQRGTCDASSLDAPGKTLYVADLKMGSGVPVYATNNPQAKGYALGALDEYAYADIEKVVVRIIQPPLGIDDVWETTPEELEKFRTELFQSTTYSWQMIKGEIPLDLRPSKDACTFCPAALHCTAKKEHIVNIITANFESIGEPMHLEIPEAVSKDTVKELYPYVDEAKKFLSLVNAEALEMAKRGQKIEGFKLVKGRKSHLWADEKQASQFLSLYLEPDELYIKSMISVAQAKKLVGKEEGFNDLVHTKEGNLTLAPESDRRKEVKPVMFKNEEQ